MNNGNILVYDDETQLGEKYVDSLEKMKAVTEAFNVETLDTREFLEEMKVLKERQRTFRDGKKWNEKDSKLDNTSILVIDYDLMNLPDKGGILTGEIVAYYTRCFSRCELIVGLNLEGDNMFD